MKNVIDTLVERGFIETVSSPELAALTQKHMTVYCGFDPTSDSLHLGNLVPIMGLAWFQRFGHTPVALMGGATGMIGDPSGKASERQLLDESTIQDNIRGIQKNLASFLDFNAERNPAKIVNNADWFKAYTYVDFLRDIGKYFRIGPMLAKDSVKSRFNSEEGMSYTEFSYQILQGYDFLYLHDHLGVNIQLGGSDQWGNITAGIELIRKTRGEAAYGVTFPLLTRSDGQKFGKSEKGAIWLTAEKLSPYEFYQYLVRVSDSDVIKLMKMLTFMELNDIYHYEKAMKEPNYIANTAQKRLAQEVTEIVHGKQGVEIALKVTEAAAPGSATVLNAETLESLGKDLESRTVSLEDVTGVDLISFLAKTGLLPSKSEAKRRIQGGGVYVNNEKISDENFILSADQLIDHRLMLIALGKKNKYLIKISKAG